MRQAVSHSPVVPRTQKTETADTSFSPKPVTNLRENATGRFACSRRLSVEHVRTLKSAGTLCSRTSRQHMSAIFEKMRQAIVTSRPHPGGTPYTRKPRVTRWHFCLRLLRERPASSCGRLTRFCSAKRKFYFSFGFANSSNTCSTITARLSM